MGVRLVLRGTPEHRSRLILMDVAIRSRIEDPQIEWFSDTSVRYYAQPRFHSVFGACYENTALRGYAVSKDTSWIILLSPICGNCLRPHTEHLNNKCLFEASCWTPLPIPFQEKRFF